MPAGRYVTSFRVAELADLLGPRDLAVLRTLALVGVATGGQLQRLHFAGLTPASAVRQRQRSLQRLHDLGVLARLGRRIGGARAGSAGFVYALDIAGQRLTRAAGGRRRHPRLPSAPFMNHRLAVTELYVSLVELTRHTPLTLARFDTEPDCWRGFLGPYGELVTLKPDAYAVLRTDRYEDRYFIEVDLATESVPTVQRKAETYRRYWASGREQRDHGVFPLVLFLVPDEPRRTRLGEVIACQPPDSQSIYHVAMLGQADETFTADTNQIVERPSTDCHDGTVHGGAS